MIAGEDVCLEAHDDGSKGWLSRAAKSAGERLLECCGMRGVRIIGSSNAEPEEFIKIDKIGCERNIEFKWLRKRADSSHFFLLISSLQDSALRAIRKDPLVSANRESHQGLDLCSCKGRSMNKRKKHYCILQFFKRSLWPRAFIDSEGLPGYASLHRQHIAMSIRSCPSKRKEGGGRGPSRKVEKKEKKDYLSRENSPYIDQGKGEKLAQKSPDSPPPHRELNLAPASLSKLPLSLVEALLGNRYVLRR
eukprot:scaffold48272_cov18-Tisochrysis_lutea.AAC.4